MRFTKVRGVVSSSLLLAAAACGNVKDNDTQPDASSIDAPVGPSAAPVNATTGGTVAEGGTLSLSGKLVTADPDNGAPDLVYTVKSLPANGTIAKSGTPLAVGDHFTQEEVTNGTIVYTHGGGENVSDAFGWSISDGFNTVPATGATDFAVTVTPVNDAPLVVNNPAATVAEGGTLVLTPAQLMASDAEGSALTFTLVAVTHGTLQKKVGAGAFSALAVNGTWTPQDIADGNVKFVDSGVDDAQLALQQSTTGGFQWKVSDVDGGVNPASGANASTFTITSVDDAPLVSLRMQSCQASGTNVPANPIISLVDPDNATSQYSICVVSILGGTNVSASTTTSPGVTTTVIPVLQNGTTALGVGSCVSASALGSLNLDSGANTSRGVIEWKLMKGAVQVGANFFVNFPVTPASC